MFRCYTDFNLLKTSIVINQWVSADYDGDDLPLALSSVSPMEPLDNTVGQPQAELEHPPSSASSHGNVGPHASDTGASADKDCSSKRPATPEGMTYSTLFHFLKFFIKFL
jgi:hypothetical protein